MDLGQIGRGRSATEVVPADAHTQESVVKVRTRLRYRSKGKGERADDALGVRFCGIHPNDANLLGSRLIHQGSHFLLQLQSRKPSLKLSLSDQSCLRVDLGVLSQGESLFFEISADSEIDILLFPSNTVSVYQNEQTYRMDSVWVSDSVFESFSGEGEWHWNVPSDRDPTRWYLVIDNLAHPQDSGEGAQGGQELEVTLDGGIISPEEFTLSDSIHRVSPGGYSVVHGPFSP